MNVFWAIWSDSGKCLVFHRRESIMRVFYFWKEWCAIKLSIRKCKICQTNKIPNTLLMHTMLHTNAWAFGYLNWNLKFIYSCSKYAYKIAYFGNACIFACMQHLCNICYILHATLLVCMNASICVWILVCMHASTYLCICSYIYAWIPV